ncbi:hypothetical protein F0562_008420 [Nyssa sinensis]|uniref:Uncharacterized protein n=1 Tax=Nyssa sinensis TaxID=561372 RepID=A0A5J5AAC4_9ASTE|nr:hypothetical protein F0562_008420 [Nyssa sinensis]
MVVALGPGKFYGSSLPRPRIYTDVKFNGERVDPPVSVIDPFMSWAEEAHWSMGGLRLKRHRLQGRIEGSVKKLRAEREKSLKKRQQSAAAAATDRISNSTNGSGNKNVSPSPPPAPMATKRRRFTALIDDDEDEIDEANHELERGDKMNNSDDDEGVGVRVKRTSARKLKDDFDRVAFESGLGKSRGSPGKNLNGGSNTVASRTRSRRSEKKNGDRTDVAKMVKRVNESNAKAKKLKGNDNARRVGEDAASTPALSKSPEISILNSSRC